MASRMFDKASSSEAPCDQHPGSPGQDTLYPSSVRIKATGYFITTTVAYPDIAGKVREMARNPDLRDRCHLVVDATGVGRPVVDLLRRADLGCAMYPVMITGGTAEHSEGGYYHVPKRDLIVGLEVLLERKALRIAAELELAETLVKELTEMRVKVTPGGYEQYGAWRVGSHDDLVLAVALGHWGARHVNPELGPGQEGHWQHPFLRF